VQATQIQAVLGNQSSTATSSSSSSSTSTTVSLLGVGLDSLLGVQLGSSSGDSPTPLSWSARRYNPSSAADAATWPELASKLAAMLSTPATAPSAQQLQDLWVIDFDVPPVLLATTVTTVASNSQQASGLSSSATQHQRWRSLASTANITTTTTVPTYSDYRPISLLLADGSAVSTSNSTSSVLSLNFSSLLFVSATPADFVCPEGAYCPSSGSPAVMDGRMWPLLNWWSLSEFVPPQECTTSSRACPGVDAQRALQGQNGSSYYFATVAKGATDLKCNTGYEGQRCATCDTKYYLSDGNCWSCSGNQDAVLTLLILGALITLSVLALAVALLSTEHLVEALGYFFVLQQMAAVGVSSAGKVSAASQQLSAFFAYLNLMSVCSTQQPHANAGRWQHIVQLYPVQLSTLVAPFYH